MQRTDGGGGGGGGGENFIWFEQVHVKTVSIPLIVRIIIMYSGKSLIWTPMGQVLFIYLLIKECIIIV